MNGDDTLPTGLDPFAFLAGGGEMGRLIRSRDWSTTLLGPVESWPQSLRTTVNICLASDLPICVIWGPGLVQLYNDGYRVICGDKHPRSMGQNFSDCWKEAWPVIGDAHDAALAGDTAFLETQHIFLERHGYVEECFFTFSFSPIRDEAGRVGGLFHPVIEMTSKMLGERRIRALRDLSARTSKAKSVDEALSLSAQTLAEYDMDLPFVLFYAIDANGHQARLIGSSGLAPDLVAASSAVDLGAIEPTIWPLEEVLRLGSAVQVNDVRRRLGSAPFSPFAELPNAALVLPIHPPGAKRAVAVFVAGVSPRLPMNEAYRSFYDLLASGVTTAVANALAFEEERDRAAALAEMDRAKIAFFSNVSHEFRTPLTLMLGPVEELLARGHAELSPAAAVQLEVVNRNGLRLLRLVNTLLDFSRIEAGRVRAAFRPTDLGVFTAELASVFRAACQRAGLRLVVDCAALTEPVYVDRDMWEKVVFNLLSNAFKFTFDGEIAVSLRRSGSGAELVVRDTGTGIPAVEMPRLFERFHRVENARGRTHEGSGIGLALVQELIRLHGGRITVESGVGEGTTFFVTIPFGIAHLPPEQIDESRGTAAMETRATPFAEEALRLLSEEEAPRLELLSQNLRPLTSRNANDERPIVLVVDDNADMRHYVVRLLAESYRAEAVQDGEAALAVVRKRMPDLILTDVMMPRLDGFELLRALRADPNSRNVPVIILSARAGEGSRIEGLEAGADDYLVKPFSARELLARVAAHLNMARMRREAGQALQQSHARFEALINAAPLGVFLVDAGMRIRQVNPKAFPVFGAIEGLIGSNFVEVLHVHWRPEIADALAAIFRRTLESGEVYRNAEFVEERQDRKEREYYDWEIHRLEFPDGQYGVVCYLTDISAHVMARQALADVDRRKDEFLATLAHELRNPLAPLSNGLQLMKRAGDNPDAVEQARTLMGRQLDHMVRLVDDLLDVSRISRGTVVLKTERMPLAAAVQNAVETSRPLFDRMGHDLTLAMPEDPIYLDGDMVRLAQVLSNLLNNAAKYTERGGRVRLSVERQASEAVVIVADSGVGIPAHMLPRVFEMFTQVDRSLERSQGGLGIGLSLVQRLVALHGGSVEARSDGNNLGSTFIVRLPVLSSLDGTKPPDADVPTVSPMSRRRMLVVDDNRDSAHSLAMLLDVMGHQTQTAHDGVEALDMAEKFRPDVALLDIGMPKLNGYEVCRRIREQEWGKGMLLVAVTGWGQAEDKRLSLEAGFDSHLVKPLDTIALEKLLFALPSARACDA